MRSFKEFLRGFVLPLAAAFVVLCLVVDVLFTHLVLRRTRDSDMARIRRLMTGHEREIPILGASKAYAAYIPGELGVPAYNYGLNGACYNVVDMLLQFELAKADRGPVVVDLNLIWDRDIGDVTQYIPFAGEESVRSLLKEHGLWSARYRLPGLRYFGCYDWYLREWLAERIQRKKRYTEHGYTHALEPRLWGTREAFAAAVENRRRRPIKWSPIESQRLRLEATLQKAPDRWMILIVSPYHRSSIESFEGLAEARSYLKSLERFPNVTVLDFSSADYPDELFKDTLHLNGDGARRFSKDVREVFSRLGVTPDARPPARKSER